jgi:hypothetical protein
MLPLAQNGGKAEFSWRCLTRCQCIDATERSENAPLGKGGGGDDNVAHKREIVFRFEIPY